MSNIIVLGVTGASQPSYSIQLKREGTVINLATASAVNIYIVKAKTGEVMNTGATNANISNAAQGIVILDYTTTVFDEETRYIGEVKITRPTGVEKLRDTIQFPIRQQLSDL